MCGIIGWIGSPNPETGAGMLSMLAHRGPDGSGEWLNDRANVWLGHRRLSIIDLSDGGLQPMHSSTGRFTIVFNGEIFNYRELKAELLKLGRKFVSESDTEVILEACEIWGVKESVQKLIGFFAIGIWDREGEQFFLIRDRIGVKPLYYSHSGKNLGFASELRPLKLLPWVNGQINQRALLQYFQNLCVPDTTSIMDGITKLGAGQILTFSDGNVSIETYWNLSERAATQNIINNPQEAFESLLIDATKRRLISDVPVGVFLSGGLDSSLVAAIIARHGGASLTAYSIGFEQTSHDETPHAERIARHIGLPIKKFIVSSNTWLGQNELLGNLHDEPFADVSSLPTHSLCKLARQDITVALSGDGGDEFYGGYPRYFWAQRIEMIRKILGQLAPATADLMQSIPKSFWDHFINPMTLGKLSSAEGLAHRIYRFAEFIKSGQVANSAYTESQHWISEILQGAIPPEKQPENFSQLSWAENMMLQDQKDYLVSDILTKVDRTSMAVGLEVRSPLLDHRLAELSWQIPFAQRVGSAKYGGKRIIRETLAKYYPPEFFERPKQGFGIPLTDWIRHEWKDWIASILFGQSAMHHDLLNKNTIEKIWGDHQSGKNRAKEIWTIVMFILWQKQI